jgi:hypothetical protein
VTGFATDPSAATRPHTVGTTVDSSVLSVDEMLPALDFHFGAVPATPLSRLSSTAFEGADASVYGGCATSSPASTAAKTMDENLHFLMDNDKNDHYVDVCGSLDRTPLVERSAA